MVVIQIMRRQRGRGVGSSEIGAGAGSVCRINELGITEDEGKKPTRKTGTGVRSLKTEDLLIKKNGNMLLLMRRI